MSEPAPARATLSNFHFSASFSPRGRFVRFAGPGGFFDADLLRGALGGQIGFAFSCLRRPSGLLSRVRRSPWTVTTPRRSPYHPGVAATPHPEKGTFRNMGRLRRILIIKGPEVAVLRFKKPIPRDLVLALKTLFEGKSYPFSLVSGVNSGKEDEEPDETEEKTDGYEDFQENRPAAEDGLEPEAGPGEGRGLDAVDGKEGWRDEDGVEHAVHREEVVLGDDDASLPARPLES